MKINLGRTLKCKKLSEISAGDTFLHEAEFYIVTNSVNYKPSVKQHDIIVVNLNDGRIHQFSRNTQVVPVKSEVTIQSKVIVSPRV